jgi:predicted nucleotidyltransferase
MNEPVEKAYKKMIIRAMKYHFPRAKVYLFGSRALGTHRQTSDIDIAIDAGKRADDGEMDRARITLENLPIPLFMDLVDMYAIPQAPKEHILKAGILWKDKSSTRRALQNLEKLST